MRILIGVFAVVLATSSASAADTAATPPPPCASPEFKQLDFWLGDWNAAWDASPGTPAGTGSNRITKGFDGCVIEEHFDGGGLIGHSVSTFHVPSKGWKQTWVDNQGGYIALSGGPEANGDFVLATAPNTAGKSSRMIFTDIKPDSFTWRWQATTDGKTWTDNWVIRYTRRKV